MSRTAPLAVSVPTALALVGVGVWLDAWWPIAAGFVAALWAAWTATVPDDR